MVTDTFTEGRVADMIVVIVLQARAKMAEYKLNELEDSIVSEMNRAATTRENL